MPKPKAEKIATGILSLVVLLVVTFVIISLSNKKVISDEIPLYELNYLSDTVSNICITIVKEKGLIIGVTDVDCAMVTAGNDLIIEDARYVWTGD